MLRITVELLPFGMEERKRHLGTAIIGNDGTSDTTKIGNYKFHLSKWGSDEVWKDGEIKGFPRETLGPWDLLYRCLRQAVGKRNGGR